MPNTTSAPVLKTGSLAQFRPPLCFELAGRTFELVLDNGYDYELGFIDRNILSYGKHGEEKKTYEYDCLKADEDTYFVNLEMTGETPRTGLTFILDLEQSLVTVEYIRIGVNPKLPKLPVTEIIFGAIRKEDGTIPSIRHGYTTEMVGRAINWNYGTFSVVHVYSSERYYRLTMTPEEVERRREKYPEYANREALNERRLYEEPSDYIKIKDGIFVFSMTERMNNIERGQGNNLLFLMNLNRMYDVGRSFGHDGETGLPENYTYGAYGRYFDASDLIARKSTEYIR